jgi:hypothetical protein
VVHGLNDAFASDEVYDVQKQKQLLQTSPIDANTVRLELSQDEYDSANFPFVCSVQGKAVAASTGTLMPGGTGRYSLDEGVLTRLNSSAPYPVEIYNTVVSAHLSPTTGRVYVYLANGTTANWMADGSDDNNVVSLDDYATDRALSTTIEL